MVPLYGLVIGYERADWDEINRRAEELGVPTNLLTSLYFNCMDVVDETWKQLTSPEPQQEKDETPEEMPAE